MTLQRCARFADILLAREHLQFFSQRVLILVPSFHAQILTSTSSEMELKLENQNDVSCHMDKQFVVAQVENVKISAKRAHPRVNQFNTEPKRKFSLIFTTIQCEQNIEHPAINTTRQYQPWPTIA